MADRIPDLFEPILAYRAWNLRGGKLHSTATAFHTWRAGENTADCKCGFGGHEIADQNAHCGFYGAWGMDHPVLASASTVGVVAYYGRVTPHEWGLRAEKARIVAVVVPPLPEPKERAWHTLPAFTKTVGQAWGVRLMEERDNHFASHPRNVLARNYPGVTFVDSKSDLRRLFPLRRPDHLLKMDITTQIEQELKKLGIPSAKTPAFPTPQPQMGQLTLFDDE